MKKLLLLSAILISVYGHAQSLLAVPDTFTVLQATVDTFAVTHNDSIPAGDSICISLLDSSAHFSVLGCLSIIYRPDSTFTGRDTCRYVLCDTGHVCDTAMVVVYVDTNYALLPVAGFVEDTTYNYSHSRYGLLGCSSPSYITGYDNTYSGPYILYNRSYNADSVLWKITGLDTCTSVFWLFRSDTININTTVNWGNCVSGEIIFCLTAYNQFGSTTQCDTSCPFRVEGIAEVPLSNIHLYPNPADRILTIDMRQNTNPISTDYTAIGIYNALGQKVHSIPRHDSSGLVEIAVAGLPDGIYVSTIVDARGTEMVLGRFTVVK
jgi:hypothetical protein